MLLRYDNLEYLSEDARNKMLNSFLYIFPNIDGKYVEISGIKSSSGDIIVIAVNEKIILDIDHGNTELERHIGIFLKNHLQEYFYDYPNRVLLCKWVSSTNTNFPIIYRSRLYITDILDVDNSVFINYDMYYKELIEKYKFYPLRIMGRTYKPTMEYIKNKFIGSKFWLIKDVNYGEEFFSYAKSIVIKNYGYFSHSKRQVWGILENEKNSQLLLPEKIPWLDDWHSELDKDHDNHRGILEFDIAKSFVTKDKIRKIEEEILNTTTKLTYYKIAGELYRLCIKERVPNEIERKSFPVIDYFKLYESILERTKIYVHLEE